MGTITSFIPHILQRLPNWIINTGALVLIILFAILATSPKMITGTIFCTTIEGERCQKLSINGNFEGRDVRTLVIDGTGTFYVPLYNSLSSQNVSLHLVKNQVELRVNHMIAFDIIPIWAGRQFTISLEETSAGKFKEPTIEQTGGNWLGAVVTALGLLNPVSNADAQELMTYDQLLSLQQSPHPAEVPNLPSAALSGDDQRIIDEAVTDAYGKTVEQSATLDPSSESMRALTPSELSAFNAEVKEQTGVSIPDTHWQFIDTKAAASQYLKSLKGLQIQYPTVFNADATNWSQIEQEFQVKTGETLVVAPPAAMQ